MPCCSLLANVAKDLTSLQWHMKVKGRKVRQKKIILKSTKEVLSVL